VALRRTKGGRHRQHAHMRQMCLIAELKSINNILSGFFYTLAIFKATPQVCIQFEARSVEKSGVVHLGFRCSRLSKSANLFLFMERVDRFASISKAKEDSMHFVRP
jgi:hypothetical protein